MAPEEFPNNRLEAYLDKKALEESGYFFKVVDADDVQAAVDLLSRTGFSLRRISPLEKGDSWQPLQFVVFGEKKEEEEEEEEEEEAEEETEPGIVNPYDHADLSDFATSLAHLIKTQHPELDPWIRASMADVTLASHMKIGFFAGVLHCLSRF